MMKKDDFYIGWQDEAPKGYSLYGKAFAALALILTLVFAILFTRSERGFIDSYFDYGSLTTISGRLVLEPVPALVTSSAEKRKTIPLVGFGKFSASPVVKEISTILGDADLSDYEVTIRGTIFKYQDKQWMELTEGGESLVKYEKKSPLKRERSRRGQMKLTGEIIDPKCFFGVMNPATKAVHRSCAIRCISGGVPAVLGIRNEGVFEEYYFLLDSRGAPVGKEILPYIGIPISLNGEVNVIDDWKTLTLESIESALMAEYLSASTLCE